MAKYGALHPVFAVITSDNTDGSNPSYGEKAILGELVKVTETPTLNEAKQYGDNRTTEYVAEFKETTLDVESTDLSDEQMAMLYGATASEEGGVAYGGDDAAPYGGFGFVSCKIKNGVKAYTGIFYPKCKAVMQATDYATKGDAITLANDKIKFLAVQPFGVKTWKDTKTFAKESEAIAWVDSQLGNT